MARYKVDAATGKMLEYDERTGAWKPERKRKGSKGKFNFNRPMTYVPDIREFVSVATAGKPVLISSRSQLARYERSNNIRQVGNDLKSRIVEKQKRRDADRAAFVQRHARQARVETKWM